MDFVVGSLYEGFKHGNLGEFLIGTSIFEVGSYICLLGRGEALVFPDIVDDIGGSVMAEVTDRRWGDHERVGEPGGGNGFLDIFP